MSRRKRQRRLEEHYRNSTRAMDDRHFGSMRPADACDLRRHNASLNPNHIERRAERSSGVAAQPPVMLMWRPTAGRLGRRSMMKSCPLGLRLIASTIACSNAVIASEARSGVPQIGRVLLAEAHVELPGAGEADPVAAFTEIVGHRRDEAEPSARFLDPHVARRAARALSRCRRACSVPRGAPARSRAAGYWSMRLGSMSPSGMTSIRVRSMPRPCAHSIRSSISSSLTPFRATVLILTLRPASCAASIPAIHLARSPQRVIAPELLGIERVDRDIDPPHAASGEFGGEARQAASRWSSGSARRGRRLPSGATASGTGAMMSRRTSGSPPVIRSLRTPCATKTRADAVELLQGQEVPLRQEGHVLRHAVDAAEVASVRHRDAQIGDGRPNGSTNPGRRVGFRCADPGSWVSSGIKDSPLVICSIPASSLPRRDRADAPPGRSGSLRRRVLLRLERQVPSRLRRIRDLPDVAPGLLVVRDDELVHPGRDDVALDARRVGEQHEGLLRLRRRRRIDHRLGRAVLVVDLDEIALA